MSYKRAITAPGFSGLRITDTPADATRLLLRDRHINSLRITLAMNERRARYTGFLNHDYAPRPWCPGAGGHEAQHRDPEVGPIHQGDHHPKRCRAKAPCRWAPPGRGLVRVTLTEIAELAAHHRVTLHARAERGSRPWMRATEGEPPASIERRWHLHGIACAANQCDYDRFSEALYLWNRDHGRTRNRRVNFEHQTHGGEAVMRYVLKHETRYLDHSAHKARSMEFSEEPYYPAITVDRHRRIAASF